MNEFDCGDCFRWPVGRTSQADRLKQMQSINCDWGIEVGEIEIDIVCEWGSKWKWNNNNKQQKTDQKWKQIKIKQTCWFVMVVNNF